MPTYTQVWDGIRTAVWIVHQDFLALVSNAEKYLDHEADHRANIRLLDAPMAAQAFDALAAYRAGRASQLLASGRALIDPLLVQMADVINMPERDPATALTRLDQYMRDQSPDDTIKQRSGTFGAAVAAGGNAGNGPILRTTVDRDGYPLDAAAFDDVITLEISADATTGALPGQEVFTYRGTSPGPDLLFESGEGGSGFTGSQQVDSADTSLLTNSSFGDLDGTIAVPTTIPGWTVSGSIANVALNESKTHRKANLEDTARSLQIKATDIIRASLDDLGIDVDDEKNTPYLFSLFFHPNSSTGTLRIRMGTALESIGVSGGTAQNFDNHLYIGRTLAAKNRYYRNWKQDAAKIKIEWTHTSGSGVCVDDAYFGPQRPLGDGVRRTWWTPLAGSANWMLLDSATLTDTVPAVGSQGILQQNFVRLYGVALPGVASGQTIAEPT